MESKSSVIKYFLYYTKCARKGTTHAFNVWQLFQNVTIPAGKKHCFIKIEFYVWQERDFESTCLTDDSWANVVFRPGPSSLWQQKQETGFPFWILFQIKTISKYHFAIWWSWLGSRLGPCLPHRKALIRCRNQDQLCVHVMSLAIQDLTACSRAEGLSDITARHMDSKEVVRRGTMSLRFLVTW